MATLKKINSATTNRILYDLKKSGKYDANAFFENLLELLQVNTASSDQANTVSSDTVAEYATPKIPLEDPRWQIFSDTGNVLIPKLTVKQSEGVFEAHLLTEAPFDLELSRVSYGRLVENFREQNVDALRGLDSIGSLWLTSGERGAPLVLELPLHFERNSRKFTFESSIVRWLLNVGAIVDTRRSLDGVLEIVMAFRVRRGRASPGSELLKPRPSPTPQGSPTPPPPGPEEKAS